MAYFGTTFIVGTDIAPLILKAGRMMSSLKKKHQYAPRPFIASNTDRKIIFRSMKMD
jgi:hypothetical protein